MKTITPEEFLTELNSLLKDANGKLEIVPVRRILSQENQPYWATMVGVFISPYPNMLFKLETAGGRMSTPEPMKVYDMREMIEQPKAR